MLVLRKTEPLTGRWYSNLDEAMRRADEQRARVRRKHITHCDMRSGPSGLSFTFHALHDLAADIRNGSFPNWTDLGGKGELSPHDCEGYGFDAILSFCFVFYKKGRIVSDAHEQGSKEEQRRTTTMIGIPITTVSTK